MSRIYVKVGSIRPNYNNFRDWLRVEQHIYVGRHEEYL